MKIVILDKKCLRNQSYCLTKKGLTERRSGVTVKGFNSLFSINFRNKEHGYFIF